MSLITTLVYNIYYCLPLMQHAIHQHTSNIKELYRKYRYFFFIAHSHLR